MKTIQKILLSLATLMAGCASSAKFPVSTVAPAAEISAKKTLDKNKNYVIELVALHLSSADRLNPPKNHYSVWIVTEQNEYKNLGQIMNVNAKRGYFKTLSPLTVVYPAEAYHQNYYSQNSYQQYTDTAQAE